MLEGREEGPYFLFYQACLCNSTHQRQEPVEINIHHTVMWSCDWKGTCLQSTKLENLFLSFQAQEVQAQFKASIDQVTTIVTHLDKSVKVSFLVAECFQYEYNVKCSLQIVCSHLCTLTGTSSLKRFSISGFMCIIQQAGN